MTRLDRAGRALLAPERVRGTVSYARLASGRVAFWIGVMGPAEAARRLAGGGCSDVVSSGVVQVVADGPCGVDAVCVLRSSGGTREEDEAAIRRLVGACS